jgi:hypothetical protein
MRGRKPRPVRLAPGDYPVLRLLARGEGVPAQQARRARVLLAVAGGERTSVVAAREGCDASTVWRACRRYERGGLSALLADGRARRGSGGERRRAPPLPPPDRLRA